MTHGVYVLSVRHGVQQAAHDEYIIVALAMQCSVEPARIALAVSVNARLLSALRAAGGGALSVLDVNQLAAVRRYGTPGGVRHPPTEVARTAHGHPVPPEAAFWMELQISSETDAGDHVLFVGDVVSAGANGNEFVPLTLAASQFPYAG